jgi:RNA polymerase sigma factor (sigma-70 family)
VATDRSDEELALLARGGADWAFSELCARHLPRLRRRVRSRIPRRIDRRLPISDVIQDAWITVFRRLAEFEPDGDGSFRRWLDRIVANKLGDGFRRHLVAGKRSVEREVTRGDRPDTKDHVGDLDSPSAAAMAREAREALRREMKLLPPDYELVLRLVYIERKTVREAAKTLSRSPMATRKLYGRALAAIATRLEGESSP